MTPSGPFTPVRRLAHAAAAALTTTSLCLSASGQETAASFVRPLLDRDQFDALCAHLEIDREQRNVTEMMFRDYADGVERLIQRTDRAAIGAGRAQVNDALAGRTNIDGHLLRRLRIDVLSTYLPALAASQELLQDLMTGLESQLLEAQVERLPEALRMMRRQVFLHPRHIIGPSLTYAGEGVDVLLLAEEAVAQGNELANVDSAALQAILNTYELQLDEVLRELGNLPEQAGLEMRIRRLDRNETALERTRATLVDAWKKVYLLNESTVEAIGALARETEGDWAASLWRDRFDRASFGWLYQDKMPDLQIAWIRSHDLDPEIHQKAELAYGMYMAERSDLVRQAIDIIVKARLEEGSILTPYFAPQQVSGAAQQMHQELLKNSGALSNVETRASGELEALLDDETRQEMRQNLRSRRR